MLSRDLLLKAGVMARIGLVEGGPDDGNRAPSFEHRRFVSCGVDAGCETREDHETAAHELAGHLGGKGAPFMRSTARTDHRDARTCEEACVAT
jgi:hypothetical protein